MICPDGLQHNPSLSYHHPHLTPKRLLLHQPQWPSDSPVLLLLLHFFFFFQFGCLGTWIQHSESLLPVAMRDLSLQCEDSLVVACRLNSCSTWAQLLHGIWDLSSPNKDQTRGPCMAGQILNHRTTREVPSFISPRPLRILYYVTFWVKSMHGKTNTIL